MAKIQVPVSSDPKSSDKIEIDLHNPWLAALLAWALPGLGHIYQGRTAKGVLFFVCVLGTFFYGWYIGGGKVVYAATDWEQQYRWQYLCQLGVGLPAAPMLVQRDRAEDGKAPLWNGIMRQPSQLPQTVTDYSGNTSQQPNELAKWIVEEHPFFELGTVYTVVAGFLNVLVICDAAGGPLIILAPDKKQKNNGSEDKSSNESTA